MKVTNPYRPGAGLMPGYLAGRDELISETTDMFKAVISGVPVQSLILSGLRGVGKTVLLNRFEEIASEQGILCSHIEVEEKNDFISQIVACSKEYLFQVRTVEKVKNLVDKVLNALTMLSVSFDPGDQTVSLTMREREYFSSSSLPQSLTQVFTSIGETARELGMPVCYCIDEMQYLKQEELGALIVALHRANQLGYPVLVLGTGLPRIYSMLAKEKTYTERLFRYCEITSLESEQAEKAVIEPAKKVNVSYDDDALELVIEETGGYPFFIQQYCQIIFERMDGSRVTRDTVEGCVDEYHELLDGGFFRSRYDRCSDSEKRFLYAMLKCGKLPCEIGSIAKNLGEKLNSISPTRARLINKGVIYTTGYSLLDYTVPDFDGFLKRNDDYSFFSK